MILTNPSFYLNVKKKLLLRQSITIDFDMSGNSGMLPFLEHLAAFFSNLLNTRTTSNWVVVFVYYLNLSMVYFNLLFLCD